MTRYCPNCSGEYQDWAETCVDCGEKLVETKPGAKLKDNKKVTRGGRTYVKEPLVAIASFASTMEAEFTKGILESEDIPSMITDADSVLLNGKNTSTVHGVSLVVRESDKEKAEEILNSIEKDISEDSISDTDNPEIGPPQEPDEENRD